MVELANSNFAAAAVPEIVVLECVPALKSVSVVCVVEAETEESEI